MRPFQRGEMLAEVAPWLLAATTIAGAAVVFIIFGHPLTNAPAVPGKTIDAIPVAPTEKRAENADRFPDIPLALTEIRRRETDLVALIAVDKQPPKPYKAGEPLTGGITVYSVSPDRVALRYRGLFKALLIKGGGPAGAFAEKSGKEERPRAMTWQERNPHINPNVLHMADPRAAEEFLRYVEVLPHDSGGFFINDVEPGSLYERLGLQSGDIIQGLESMTTSDGGGRPDTAEVRMEVFRDGQSVILTYRPEQ